MKKLSRVLFSFVLVVSVFVCSCSSVFAKNNAEFTLQFPCANNTTGLLGSFNTSKLDSSAHKFMQNYYSGNGKFIVYSYNSTIYFVLLPSNISKSNIRYDASGDRLLIETSLTSVSFDLTTGNPISVSVVSSPGGLFASNFIQYQSLVALGVPKSDIPFIWKPVKLTANGDFLLNFDDGLKDKPVVVPPVSSEPEIVIPPYNPTIPDIGASTSEFVPYDATLWNGFLAYILKSIGNSTNIGLLILAIIVGIYLVIRIVKHFSK